MIKEQQRRTRLMEKEQRIAAEKHYHKRKSFLVMFRTFLCVTHL